VSAPDWTEFTARRPSLTPRALRDAMEPQGNRLNFRVTNDGEAESVVIL